MVSSRRRLFTRCAECSDGAPLAVTLRYECTCTGVLNHVTFTVDRWPWNSIEFVRLSSSCRISSSWVQRLMDYLASEKQITPAKTIQSVASYRADCDESRNAHFKSRTMSFHFSSVLFNSVALNTVMSGQPRTQTRCWTEQKSYYSLSSASITGRSLCILPQQSATFIARLDRDALVTVSTRERSLMYSLQR